MTSDRALHRSEQTPWTGNVDDVVAGSVAAWHAFLYEFSELIYRVIARHLPAEDEDEVRNIYVDVLQALYRGDLKKYSRRGSLHAWLAVYARRRALDFVRSKYGRIRPPSGYEHLTPLEQDVFDIYVLERGSMEMLIHMLEWKGYKTSGSDITDALIRIEAVIDSRYLRRLDYQRLARSHGIPSATAMEFVVKTRWEYERRARSNTPDAAAMASEAANKARQLREAIADLPNADQEILSMKFEKRMTATEISQRLELGGQRQAYTAVARIIRGLRRKLGLEKR